MVILADGDRRPVAVVVPEHVQAPEDVVQPNLYPALFQVILLVYSCVFFCLCCHAIYKFYFLFYRFRRPWGLLVIHMNASLRILLSSPYIHAPGL